MSAWEGTMWLYTWDGACAPSLKVSASSLPPSWVPSAGSRLPCAVECTRFRSQTVSQVWVQSPALAVNPPASVSSSTKQVIIRPTTEGSCKG